MEVLEKLLPTHIFERIKHKNFITEIRLRIGSIIKIGINGKYFGLFIDKERLICQKSDIEHVLRVATNNSLYSVETAITEGYICYFGYRIGISGEGVIVDNKILTIKNVSSLCIRIPRDDIKLDKSIYPIINKFDNTLIVSKPGCGKTTLIRLMAKELADSNNVLILDDRGEISYNNICLTKDNCDVVLNISKDIAYRAFIRVMNPNIVVTDEIFGEKEVDAILDLIRCGVKVLATLHLSSLSDINSKYYAKLLASFRYIVFLKDIGKIDKILDRGKWNLLY